jgi:hypothetical protein
VRPFKFFDKIRKQTIIRGPEYIPAGYIVVPHKVNPYQELVIDMIRECNRLNISLIGIQETVYNHRIIDIHIYNDWHGDDVDVTYIVDEGGTYRYCRFTMDTQEFNTATSV